MDDESVQQTMQNQNPRHGWRVLGWVMLGVLLGAALVAVFLAYGQPELLLEQLNLRYCG
jgi:disulfide bond formation protein DsbB